MLDTRKTTPLLRALEKYAVRAGGGVNHRSGLDDGILIKDNHIRLAGGVVERGERGCAKKTREMPTEVEAQSLQQVDDALAAGADIILLDNLSTADIIAAVQKCRGRAKTEISGGVTLARMPELAATGADYVSVGALTHSAPAADSELRNRAALESVQRDRATTASVWSNSAELCLERICRTTGGGAIVRRTRVACVCVPEVASTNDVAVRFAEGGAEEGRRRRCRCAERRPGTAWTRVGIARRALASTPRVILRPPARVVPLMTIAAGVALAEGIESATGLPVTVKWPNDVFVERPGGPTPDRKIAGILAEGGTSATGGGWVVLGFGINVLPGATPPDVASRATSLETELGRPVGSRSAAGWNVLPRCRADTRTCATGESLRCCRRGAHGPRPTFGRRVEWERDGRAHHGVALDIDESGALLIRTDAGVQRVISGELRWR